MIPLSLICIAALIGYRIALKDVDDFMKFQELSAKAQAGILALGVSCSIIIMVCFLVFTGAL